MTIAVAVSSAWRNNVAADDESGLLLRRSGKPTHISITLAFGLSVLVLVSQGTWFASSYSNRITALEKSIDAQSADTKAARLGYEADKARRSAEIEVIRQQQQVQNVEVAKALSNVAVQLEGLNANVGFLKQQFVNPPVRQTR